MKILTILVCLMLIPSLSYAGLYVVLDGNDPKGTVRVQDQSLSGWETKYTMIKVDESYSGKHHYEIKYDGVEVRHATQEEIDDYKAQKKAQGEALVKQKFLEWFEDEDVKNKIKEIKP